jgi:hypothetical protein
MPTAITKPVQRPASDFGIPVMRQEESKKQSPNRLFSTSDDSPVRFDSLHSISESSMRMQSAGIISPDWVDKEKDNTIRLKELGKINCFHLQH